MKQFVRPALAGFSVVVMMAAVAVAPAQKKAPASKGAPKAAVAFASADKVLKAKCVGCHQGEKPAAGVNLSSYAEVMKAKWKGKPVVVAKKPADSILSKAVHGTGVDKMPPGGSLMPGDIKTIDAWIAAGAKK